MTRRAMWIGVAAAAVLMAGAGLSTRTAAAKGASVCDADAKPANLNFTLKDMHGRPVTLSAYKGRVIVLDFWATWCGPCKLEIPGFVKLQAKYANRGFTVIGVSVDDKAPLLPPFAKQFKMNYPVLVGLGEQKFQDAYGPLWAVPTTFVIGRNGTICRKHVGISSMEEFEREIQSLL
ncbi:MAG TPA: TlpA disulfide reductase family protein [Vicinamibacterales bacterium]|nr:TlpA disulfide reductase family protein [Vicinamibacterales bacterium]